MLLRKHLFVVLGVAIAAIGCGGGGPLTVEEYGRAVCPHMGVQIDVEEPTWGDYTRVIEDTRGRFDVTPPGALRAYHEAFVAYIDALVNFSREQPSREQIVDTFDMWLETKPLAEKLERIVENMNPERRAVLAEHGCV